MKPSVGLSLALVGLSLVFAVNALPIPDGEEGGDATPAVVIQSSMPASANGENFIPLQFASGMSQMQLGSLLDDAHIDANQMTKLLADAGLAPLTIPDLKKFADDNNTKVPALLEEFPAAMVRKNLSGPEVWKLMEEMNKSPKDL
ncbi:hypothetical protein BJ085DRAFT_39945 [Dimargaris cristalligena]|uniref:Uncharacterized protein n=1 Tax=Dimargaris cristalligena TaxID=215637 RepID=A0A4P9ZT29_9FUNG|nr:hypothetical protein BJ085DRAFT_39945 [Dimargaris cristalligena]|eukprot:RKP35660.1 hypothetical protein BJ085DRAFT_39945 [Dimargaris cristalligena]